MANVHYVATCIPIKQADMTAFEPQDLVSETRPCSLVWSEEPLSTERIKTWAIGPVLPVLCARRRPICTVYTEQGGKPEEQTVDASVGRFPLDKTSRWLARLTHQADAWRVARDGMYPRVIRNQEITQAAVAYRCLPSLREGPRAWPSVFHAIGVGPELRPSARAARTSS
jgi:uncharacterized phage-associated protein